MVTADWLIAFEPDFLSAMVPIFETPLSRSTIILISESSSISSSIMEDSRNCGFLTSALVGETDLDFNGDIDFRFLSFGENNFSIFDLAFSISDFSDFDSLDVFSGDFSSRIFELELRRADFEPTSGLPEKLFENC